MAVEIEGLEFQIEAKSENAAKGVDALINSFNKLKAATKGGAGLNNISKKLDAISNAKLSMSGIEKIEDLTKSLNSLSNVKISSTISKRITEIGASLDGLNLSGVEKVEALSTALQNMQGIQIPNMRNLTGNQTAAPTGTAAPVDPAGATNAGAVATAATSGITKYTSQIIAATTQTRGFLGVLQGVGGVFSRAFSAVGGVALKAFQAALKGVSTAAKSAVNACKKLGSTIGSKLSSKVKQTTSGMGQLFSSLKRIAMYRAIRFFFAQLTAAMKEGIQNLYMYSSLMGGTFKGSMDSLATSFQYLKNSMGAMVAPLINMIAPAVDALIDKFAALLNIVNQFFARLSGATTFTKAKKAAASYGDSISGAGKSAKKAAKDIKDATVGIDELNIISQKDSSGSGSGSKNYGDMFETVPIDSSISEFTDKLKAALDAGDWKTLGTLLGEKFNEIVDSIDWSGIGHKIGYGLNGAIQTAYWFLKTADFKNLGNHIAELLNGAMEEIDFTYLGRLLVRGVTVALDFMIGLLGGLNWSLVGKSIGDFFKGAFNEAQEWIASYNWNKMGKDLWKNLKACIKGIDFAGVAQSFFKLLGSALAAAVSFIAGFVQGIWEDITGYFQEYLTNDDGTKKCGLDWVAGLLEGIWDGIKNIGKWIKENVFDPFIDGFKECFGIHSPSTVMKEMGGYVVEGFLQGLNKFSEIAGKVKKWAGKVIEWFTKGEDGKGIVEHFKEIGGNIVSGFKDKVGGTYTTVKSNVTTWASKVKDWFSNNSFGGVNSDTFSTFANNTIEGFRTKVGSAYTNTKTNVTTWASKVKEWFTNSSFGGVNSTNFQTFAGNVIEGFRTKVGSAYTTTKSNMVTWATNVKEWFTNSGFGGVNSANFQTFANNVVTGFKDKIGSAYVNTKSNMTTWATNVKNWFSGIASASAFSGFATSVVDGFKNRIGGYYTAAQGNMSTFGSRVKSWFTAHCSYNGFYNVASDVVSGFKNGIGELYHTCKSTISSWGSSIISWFKDKLDVNSPSKVFYEIGGFAVAGFNNAIAQVGKSTKSVVGTWADSFTNFSPTMALAVDTSALKYYDSAAFSRSISSNVQSSTEVSATGFREAMEDFYHEYVEPTMVQMADDMRRQADKEEKTVVQVGNRVVTDAVTTQKKANGYSFTG
ncbi:hypothetical protein CK3_02560 [butyrate-producing bacterium SS3/4]|nr:hypothetical protein CK3_02560 [butyrate-producing bacterium SS3/4]